jgi:hypothetical protein
MNPKAVEKAKSRIRVAEKALSELTACPDYPTLTDTWYTFLVSAKNVYTVLEQGAKVSPQSRQWFGAKANERKNDELLQYMFQARNDDEHGLEDVTKLKPGSVAIGVNAPGFSNHIIAQDITINNGQISIRDVQSGDERPVLIEVTPPSAHLVPIRGRGVLFPIPTTHLGKPVENQSPYAVAELCLTYLSKLVDEAERLA